MAEGSKDGANPFSFKSFLKRSSSEAAVVGEQRVSTGPKTTRMSKRKNDGSKMTGSGEESLPFPELNEDDGKEKGGADNPFSFTKFVKTKKTKKTSRPHSTALPLVGGQSSDSSAEDSSSEVSDLFSTDTPLTKSKQPTKGSKSSRSYSLPVQPDPSLTTRNKTTKQTVPLRQKDIFESDSDSSFSLNEDDSLLFQKSTAGTLIDLGAPPTHTGTTANGQVGVVIPPKGADPPISLDADSDSFGSSLSLEGGTKESFPDMSGLPDIPGERGGEAAVIRKLKAENEKLKSELLLSKQETNKQKEKNSGLKEKLKSFKKKEAEDTKALEDMVQKVESNLVATTKRAASAESTILKMKQEISSLQTQLAQASPQSVHQKYEEMLRGVREKANFASLQLVTASQKADQSIRDLVSGVETLRNVSEILQFIDSVTELKEQHRT